MVVEVHENSVYLVDLVLLESGLGFQSQRRFHKPVFVYISLYLSTYIQNIQKDGSNFRWVEYDYIVLSKHANNWEPTCDCLPPTSKNFLADLGLGHFCYVEAGEVGVRDCVFGVKHLPSG